MPEISGNCENFHFPFHFSIRLPNVYVATDIPDDPAVIALRHNLARGGVRSFVHRELAAAACGALWPTQVGQGR